jgi:polar amino acid transport system substrate-binding protein
VVREQTPSNGKGYESAVAYAIAKELGIKAKSRRQVGRRALRLELHGRTEILRLRHQRDLLHAERAQAVTFSVSYYDVNQSIVALKTNRDR